MFNSLQCHEPLHASLPCHSLSPGACSNSCPLCQWCHPTISSSVVPFSSGLLSFPASGAFSMSQFFTSGGQSIGASVWASVLQMNIQDWFPLGLTGLISLQSKGLLRIFSSTSLKASIFWCSWLDTITDTMDMSLSKLQEIVEDRGAWHAAVHGIAKS